MCPGVVINISEESRLIPIRPGLVTLSPVIILAVATDISVENESVEYAAAAIPFDFPAKVAHAVEVSVTRSGAVIGRAPSIAVAVTRHGFAA